MKGELMRIAVRVYSGQVLQSFERLDVGFESAAEIMPALAEKHAAMLAAAPGYIEIEFLDEPDVNKRFFRLGNDPAGMREPVEVSDFSDESILRRWGGW